MKRSSILFFLFFIPSIILAQQTSEEEKEPEAKVEKSELKLNMLEIIVNPAIGITYERFLNPYSSYGAYAYVNFKPNNGYRSEQFEIAPFYRIYFQRQEKKLNQGLFTEIFLGINKGETEYYQNEDYEYNYYDSPDLLLQEYLGVALGVTIGYKFMNFNDYSFEIFGGAGRFLNDQEVLAYPRLGISIGKRF